MKNRLLVLLFFVIAFASFAPSVAAQAYYGSTDLKTFRDGRDHEMRDPKETPFTEDGLAKFTGLKYYDTDKKFRVKGKLTVEILKKTIRFQTSSGKTDVMLKYGIVTFKLNGKDFSLNVYRPEVPSSDENADLLFIPFTDQTSGKETYGAGRYIDIRMPPAGKDKVILDFNLAYNPNCAYGSDRYNCPLPPKENKLDIAVTAGEKKYLDGH